MGSKETNQSAPAPALDAESLEALVRGALALDLYSLDELLAASVEAYLDHFEAASEFSSPHFEGDGCGEVAGMVLEHCKDGAVLTGDAVYNVRADMAAKGYKVNGGTTMPELVDYFSKHRGLDIVEACPYDTPHDQIHKVLLAHAGRDGILLQVDRAYELTDNERGVRSHFVALGAIHPTAGYKVANGDDVAALNPHHGEVIPSRWMPWSVLELADPKAVAIVRNLPHRIVSPAPAVPSAPAPQPAPSSHPTQPIYFDHETITLFRSELTALQAATSQQLAAIVKAIASLPADPHA